MRYPTKPNSTILVTRPTIRSNPSNKIITVSTPYSKMQLNDPQPRVLASRTLPRLLRSLTNHLFRGSDEASPGGLLTSLRQVQGLASGRSPRIVSLADDGSFASTPRYRPI